MGEAFPKHSDLGLVSFLLFAPEIGLSQVAAARPQWQLKLSEELREARHPRIRQMSIAILKTKWLRLSSGGCEKTHACEWWGGHTGNLSAWLLWIAQERAASTLGKRF